MTESRASRFDRDWNHIRDTRKIRGWDYQANERKDRDFPAWAGGNPPEEPVEPETPEEPTPTGPQMPDYEWADSPHRGVSMSDEIKFIYSTDPILSVEGDTLFEINSGSGNYFAVKLTDYDGQYIKVPQGIERHNFQVGVVGVVDGAAIEMPHVSRALFINPVEHLQSFGDSIYGPVTPEHYTSLISILAGVPDGNVEIYLEPHIVALRTTGEATYPIVTVDEKYIEVNTGGALYGLGQDINPIQFGMEQYDSKFFTLDEGTGMYRPDPDGDIYFAKILNDTYGNPLPSAPTKSYFDSYAALGVLVDLLPGGPYDDDWVYFAEIGGTEEDDHKVFNPFTEEFAQEIEDSVTQSGQPAKAKPGPYVVCKRSQAPSKIELAT